MNDSNINSDDKVIESYSQHVEMVYRICFMSLRNVPDTEDAVQTVFLKLIQSGKTFIDLNHEKAWLIVTSQNHCKNIQKNWWKRKRVNLEGILETTNDPIFNEVLEQLMALPHKYRIVLYLFYYEGYSSKEIAEILDIKDSTIRTQLRNGRKQFKMNF
ncbi:RNA polymerase sigma factor [Paenibacillus sp. NPDC057934]|uniref:RNA polymerase sigma factor n=1 Tax=Paenibacillus sp. NPDC057934 TaxID=3346282 RepID=UPI0036DC73B7